MNLTTNNIIARIGGIGSSPTDSKAVLLQKTLLVAFAVSMSVMGLFWGAIYFYFKEPIAASIPVSYSIVSFISLSIFGSGKSYRFFRISQLFFSLILPFFLMIALGGLANSSAVIVWSLTSPLGAVVFMGKTKALKWFVAYFVLIFLTLFLDSYYASPNNLSNAAIIGFYVMNIGGVSTVVLVLVRYFVGEKNLALRMLENKHRWIKEAFSAYISPNLVDYLIEHPEELKLGGERRECTFVFTDLAGFTKLVEQSDAATIVTLLNEYIDGMTKIAFRFDGTIDKIVGDAIAVMFSAPIYQKDHAELAVNCALEMDRFALKFSETKKREGVELGETRIGVNTGSVIIGNVGSKTQFDYRALGDAVNTAARLENVNKYLGTRVCISGFTVSKCPDFIGRPIGSLVLQGKSKAVDTYEPLDKTEYHSDRISAYHAAYNLLEKEDSGAYKAFNLLAENYPQDRLATFHAKRLKFGVSGKHIVFNKK